jgi:hypothetical protein
MAAESRLTSADEKRDANLDEPARSQEGEGLHAVIGVHRTEQRIGDAGIVTPRPLEPRQRASTVAGARLKPSRGLWHVAHERPLPPGNGRKKLTAPRITFIRSPSDRCCPVRASATSAASVRIR